MIGQLRKSRQRGESNLLWSRVFLIQVLMNQDILTLPAEQKGNMIFLGSTQA
jgi:hypothetical protein